jgi:hypothetical protein
MHDELMHAAVQRRADVDALELVLGRNRFSISSEVFARISASSLLTSLRRS